MFSKNIKKIRKHFARDGVDIYRTYKQMQMEDEECDWDTRSGIYSFRDICGVFREVHNSVYLFSDINNNEERLVIHFITRLSGLRKQKDLISEKESVEFVQYLSYNTNKIPYEVMDTFLRKAFETSESNTVCMLKLAMGYMYTVYKKDDLNQENQCEIIKYTYSHIIQSYNSPFIPVINLSNMATKSHYYTFLVLCEKLYAAYLRNKVYKCNLSRLDRIRDKLQSISN